MKNVKRSYVAPRREANARETRRVVLETARALFVKQGYVATTIDQIAGKARVSRPTVFAVGSKAGLLKLARAIAMAGDDEPLAIAQRESFQQILAEPDARESLRLFAAHVVGVNCRYADLDEVLHLAAESDADLADLWTTSEGQRHRGAEVMVDNLATKGPLGLPRAQAIDVLALLMTPGHYHHLVLTRGWSHTQYRDWLTAAMPALLLG